MTALPGDLAAAAQGLAAAGWRVHPLRPNSKLPMLPGWPELATSDAATVAAWWAATPAANIGIATGHHGVIVLDVDCKDGAPGFASLAALTEKQGPIPSTLTASTPSGGRHFYMTSPVPLRNSAGRIAAGLDVRASNGFCVAAPSLIDGKQYQWVDLAHIAVAPAWLIAMAERAAPTDIARTGAPATVEATPELLADLSSALQSIPADDRGTWVAMGSALRPLGEHGRELWEAWSATSDKHDIERDPQAFDTFGHEHTGPAAVFAEAQRNGWQNPATTRRAAEVFGGAGGSLVPAGPALRSVDLADVMTATVAPPRFVVAPLVPAGHLTLFGSHGGAGKSILALAIAAHVAAGVPWAGHAVMQCPVLYVSLEDAGEVVRYRLRRVIGAYGLDAAHVAANMRVLDGTAGHTALMTERMDFGVKRLEPTATLTELRAAVCDAGLLVIDNASDAYDGDENARRQVRSFVRELAALGHANDAGVLLLAHIDKAAARYGSQGNSYSGSSAWHNSARSRLALVTTPRGAVQLVQEKLNLGKSAAPIALCWTHDGVLIPDPVGPAADVAADAEAVLAAIRAAIADGASVPTTRMGPATAQSTLERYPDLPAKFRGAMGRENFWNAISELQRSGKISAEKYLNASRHTRERFCASAPVAPVTVIGATSRP